MTNVSPKEKVRELYEYHNLGDGKNLLLSEQVDMIKDVSGKSSLTDAYAAMVEEKKKKAASTTAATAKPVPPKPSRVEKVDDARVEVIPPEREQGVPQILIQMAPKLGIGATSGDLTWSYCLPRIANWFQAALIGGSVGFYIGKFAGAL